MALAVCVVIAEFGNEWLVCRHIAGGGVAVAVDNAVVVTVTVVQEVQLSIVVATVATTILERGRVPDT